MCLALFNPPNNSKRRCILSFFIDKTEALRTYLTEFVSDKLENKFISLLF